MRFRKGQLTWEKGQAAQKGHDDVCPCYTTLWMGKRAGGEVKKDVKLRAPSECSLGGQAHVRWVDGWVRGAHTCVYRRRGDEEGAVDGIETFPRSSTGCPAVLRNHPQDARMWKKQQVSLVTHVCDR